MQLCVRNIYVCNAPNSVSVGAVAEMTIGLMLAVGRKIVEASKAIQRGEWTVTWSPEFFVGRGLMNSTVGIVGMGRIGQAILKRLLAFDVSKVLYYDVRHPVTAAEELGAKYASFEDLLKKSDYIISMCNLTEESRGLFDSRAFSLMKTSAVFINTSRGGVVEQDALYEALKNNKIKAAGIDVMYPEPLPKDDKLTTLPNIVLLPHIAGGEETAINMLGVVAAKNIIAVLNGESPLTPVV